ncbi:hypothetical protein BLNAU_11092 [Blattamonas nauphoetae]|uniref:Right handed beta helix domain-containing protein n=1 Tax=Blattamonas nauphoetae TaxID=2049346 RepID=A0ABQ9XQZ4_9EUKA|nr:hypothetical protein BLNAU_11092 [Blattamonas nauphoetae]
MRISASELAICDSCLTFGTGPLIGFGCGEDQTERGGEQAVLPWKVSTLLMQSQIMNTTNTPSDLIMEDTGRMELTQRVTRCSICSSTNHLYGTACVDMNLMGSLLSLNTSFSSCLTDTPTHLGQHFKTQQTLTQSAFFKLCTFKDCSSSTQYGGAIYLDRFGSLRIEECSFKTCQAPPSSQGGGGAVFFNASTAATFIATSSSFVGCSSESGGGSIFLFRALSTTLLNCVFIDSLSASHGGGIFINGWNAASTSSSITNCLFENCTTTRIDVSSYYSGGALYFTSTVSIQFNFVHFRGNKAHINPGYDIMFTGTPPLITSETMVGCQSTSDSPRLVVYGEAEGTDDHLPNPPTSVTHVSCVGEVIDSDTAEFALKMSEIVTGTVLVLIDNTGGSRYPTSTQAPNIGRVLSFSLDNSIESKCSVSLGESGLVQTPLTAYQVIKSSSVGSVVLSASCILDESKENAFITISGSGIPSGILSVTLSDNTILDFEFRQHQTTSKILTVPLTGDTPKFEVGEPFPIISLESKTMPSQLIVAPWQIKFSALPYPHPRLTTVEASEYDEALKTVSISLEGVSLSGINEVTLSVNGTETVTIEVVFSSSNGQLGGILFDTETPTNVNMSYNTRYEVVGLTKDGAVVTYDADLFFTTIVEPTRLVSMECGYDEAKKNALIRMTGQVLDTKKRYEIELNDSNNVKKTIEMTFDSTSKWEGSAILYSQSESVELEYGMTYSVSGFKTKGETSSHPYEDLTITIENEPSRVEGVSRVLDGEKTKMIVSLTGRELKSGMGKIGVSRGNSKWTSDTEIVLDTDGKWKTEFQVDFSESSSVLEYVSTYTLCGLDGSAFFVNEGIAITVPNPPIVSSTFSELNTTTHSSFRVVMSGFDLPASGTGSFTASFSDSAGTFVIMLSESSEWRSDWIEVSKTSAFEFNKTYTLASLIDSSSGTADHILCSGVMMTTPLGPTLAGVVDVSLTGTSLDSVSIVVKVYRIVADTFAVSVFDVDDASKELIPLSVSFSSCDLTEGVMTHSVSWDSALQYGHRYEIASMSSSTMAVSIPSKLVFEVPTPLSSFNHVSLTHNSINTFIRIQFSGKDFIGSYVVTLTSDFSFAVTTQSPASAVSEEIALGWPDSLAFNTLFTIQSIVSTSPDVNVLLTDTLTFTTPKKQDPLNLLVDGGSGETNRFCGESSRPCSSVEVAWEIVSQIEARTPTIGIVSSATLGSPIRISNGMVALISNSGSRSLTIIAAGQLEVGDSSTLKLSTLSLEIDTLTSGRTVELITVSAGSLIVSSCDVFVSTTTVLSEFNDRHPDIDVEAVSVSFGRKTERRFSLFIRQPRHSHPSIFTSVDGAEKSLLMLHRGLLSGK